MFKEKYKAANNSIPINDELLENLLNQARESAKNKSVIKFQKIFKYGTPVAAAIVLLVTLSLFPNLAKKEITDVSDKTQISSEENMQSVQYAAKNMPEDNSMPAKIQSEATQEYEVAADSEEVAVANDKAFAMRAFDAVAKDKTVQMGIDEYLNLSGIDLSGISLPDGVLRTTEFISPSFDSDGSLILGECFIEFLGNGKTLCLSISKTDSSSASNVSAEENTTIYMKKREFFLIADFTGFSAEEIETFKESVK